MDVNCWEILGIDPTEDQKKIKRAYAKKLKQLDMEKDAHEFQVLKEAFDQAVSGKKPRSTQLIVDFSHLDIKLPISEEKESAAETTLFEQLCFRSDFRELSQYLENEIDQMDIVQYEEKRRFVHHFIFEHCFYLSPKVIEIINESFAFTESDDGIYGENVIQKMQQKPAFPFELIKFRQEGEEQSYFERRHHLFVQLADDSWTESWLSELEHCRQLVVADETLDFLELCYWFRQDFRLMDATVINHMNDLFSRFAQDSGFNQELTFFKGYTQTFLSQQSNELSDDFWDFEETANFPTSLYHLLKGNLDYQLKEFKSAAYHWGPLISFRGIELFTKEELKTLLDARCIHFMLYEQALLVEFKKEEMEFQRFLENLDYFYSLGVWKEFLRSCEADTEKLDRMKKIIRQFLLAEYGYQYVSSEIIDYLRQYFSWHTKEDFCEQEEGQEEFLLIQEIPTFSFEVCLQIPRNQRKEYLMARYQLYRVLNFSQFDLSYWCAQLEICENLYDSDLDVKVLKMYERLMNQHKISQTPDELLKEVQTIDGCEKNPGYLFVQEYLKLSQQKRRDIRGEMTLTRAAIIPPKVFHLLMGRLCYQFSSYDYAYGHWYNIVVYDSQFLTENEIKMFEKYDFRGASNFLYALRNGQFVVQAAREYSFIDTKIWKKHRSERIRGARATLVVVMLCIGLGKFAVREITYNKHLPATSSSVSQQINDSNGRIRWNRLRYDGHLGVKYYYYVYAPTSLIDQEEKQYFFEEEMDIPEEKKQELMKISDDEDNLYPNCTILGLPTKEGKMLRLVKNGSEVLALFEEENNQIIAVYNAENENDQTMIENTAKLVENNPYQLGKYILEYSIIDNAVADHDKDNIIRENSEIFLKLSEMVEALKNAGDEDKLDIKVHRFDEGYAVLFEKGNPDSSKKFVQAELIFDGDCELEDVVYSNEENDLSAKWDNLKKEPGYEEITEQFFVYRNGSI